MNRRAVFRGNQNGQFNHGTSVIAAVILPESLGMTVC